MNDAPSAAGWTSRIPPRRLALFAAFAALYVGIYSALFARKIAEYFREVLLAFDFARRWLDWLAP